MRSIRASEFKAKCLAILDEVNETGEPVTILKRGHPVARLLPALKEQGGYPQETLQGTIRFLGDVIEPVLPPDAWEVEGTGD
jgi:prevent-host-death family protein